LNVSFDTWDNGATESIAIDIKMGQTLVAHKRFSGTRDLEEPAPYACEPITTLPGGGQMSIETDPAGTPAPGTFVDLNISVTESGAFSLTYKGVELYKELALPGWAPRAGRWVIGGRTGNANDNHWIDNLNINTISADQIRPYVSGITPSAQGLRNLLDSQPIVFNVSAPGFDLVDASVKLTLNGVDVTSSTVIAPGAGPFDKTVTYTPTAPYAPGSRQEAILTYSDNGTPAGAGVARIVFWVSPVPILGTLYIESEDFNYNDGTTSGLFFDFGSPSGSYDGKGAVQGVDHNQGNGTGNPDSDLYRTEQPNNGISVPGGAADAQRGDITITPDYKVGWNDAGDWYNYTRTFPNTTYKIFGRFSSGGADTHAQLDRVTGDRSLPNQTTVPLGRFDAEATAGWDTFCFIPLRNANGDDVIVRLKDVTTITDTLRPNVITAEPAAGSLSVRNPKLRVVIADADTAVVASTIKLFLDNVQVTPITVTDTASGAEAEFQAPLLAEGSTHTVKVTFSDNDATPANLESSWSFSVGPFKGGGLTLFIEAEDFNYSNDDGTNPGQHVEFGDATCSILGKSGVQNVDWNEANPANDGGAVPAYRQPTGVECAKPGTDGFVRGDQVVACSYIVGWNDAGDWYNYTRTFAGNKRYNVYARLASGGAAESAELAIITSDPTLPNQTKQPIGTFNSPATGNWDVFHTVAMKDGAGNLASVRLSGLTTVRFSVLPGNLDVNYIAFVESDVQFITPTVTSAEPRPNSDYARQPRITAVIADQDSKVVASTIKLVVDGTDVTSSSTVTDTASGATIAYQVPAASPLGSVHNVHLEYKDDQATPASLAFDWSYKEGIYNAEKNLFIEAEDFNTQSGLFLPSNPGTGDPFNAKGLYNTLPATHLIDYFLAGTNPDSPLYRQLNPPNGIVNLDDSYRTGAGPRPGFEVVPDYKVGWTDPNDWFNYTRDYGAGGVFNIYLRASHGDPVATIGGGVDLVTGATTDAQTTSRIGNFRAPATGNWDGFIFIPLKAADGSVASVPLAGEKTLRYTVEANGGDINYMMLVPVACSAHVSIANGNVSVQYPAGVLQSAPALTGPWSNVANAAPPVYTAPVGPGVLLFRIICP
jgi:hypothetical protein